MFSEMLIYAQIKCWRNFITVHGWRMYCSDHANAAVSQPRCWVIFHAFACYITDFYIFIYLFILLVRLCFTYVYWSAHHERHANSCDCCGTERTCGVDSTPSAYPGARAFTCRPSIRFYFLVFLSHSKENTRIRAGLIHFWA
jgi:hypothetical protein